MNKLFLIILSAFLLLPVNFSWAVEADVSNENTAQVEIQETESVNTEEVSSIEEESDVGQINAGDVYKQPLAKKKLVKKFLAAMGGVAVSSFALFFLLTIYNKTREKFLNPIKTNDGEVSLESPEDLNGAVKSFLDKTKWD